MTQKTKLEILGPYTPEHEGPFALLCGVNQPIECNVHSVVEGSAFVTSEYMGRTPFIASVHNIKNAREVPVAREFWVNEYAGGGLSVYASKEEAKNYKVCLRRTIHVREVMPGESE
ncbi:hypothetical protein [Acetobacter syzygii]|uniref:hypothetical protein n=1 Tax=Acetobacter syzygii TaxID=146476 RepID=UPI00156E5E15|nr:hypothetical protein [Acetobacter syzygii]NSL93881.1 hypothetical protein [Acetobacter syzygii]